MATASIWRRVSGASVVFSALLALVGLPACSAGEPGVVPLPDITADLSRQVAFTCTHEAARVPARDPQADQLYKHARWLRKQNILKDDPAAYLPIERLLRIATAYGHDRANIELRDMLDKGLAVSADPANESIDLVQDLIKRGVPAGYYDMGWYLEHGYGVRRDAELAFKYYRMAADLGNPEAQYLVGDKLTDLGRANPGIAKIGWSMYRCAADQSHGKAAEFYALNLGDDGHVVEAMRYFQLAVASGSSMSALSMADAFSEEQHADPVWGLGQAADAERQRRYKRIQKFLSDYSYLNPKVPEINDIVPLPPAKLPPWDGKFKWVKDHEANVPPPLPSEARIVEMAKAKGLDPKTGRRSSSQP